MKFLCPLFLLLLGLITSGCESVRSDLGASFKEKISGPTFRTRRFDADQRKVYEAAREALKRMEYTFVKGGPAQGKLEALGLVQPNESMSTTRQVRLQMSISPLEDGSEVAVLFSEVVEGDFARDSQITTERSMRQTNMYDVLFTHMDAALKN